MEEEKEDSHRSERKRKADTNQGRRGGGLGGKGGGRAAGWTDLETDHYSLWSLLPSSSSSPSQHSASSSCGSRLVLRCRLPGVRVGLAEGQAAGRRGDGGL